MITDRQAKILQEARDFVYAELKDEMSGHDWWHIVRVTNNAVEIATQEKNNIPLWLPNTTILISF